MFLSSFFSAMTVVADRINNWSNINNGWRTKPVAVCRFGWGLTDQWSISFAYWSLLIYWRLTIPPTKLSLYWIGNLEMQTIITKAYVKLTMPSDQRVLNTKHLSEKCRLKRLLLTWFVAAVRVCRSKFVWLSLSILYTLCAWVLNQLLVLKRTF